MSMEGLLWVEADTDVKVSSYSCEDEVIRLRKRLINAENFLQMQVLLCNSVAIYICAIWERNLLCHLLCVSGRMCFLQTWYLWNFFDHYEVPHGWTKVAWCSHS